MHPFAGIPFEWRQVEVHGFQFMFDVTNHAKYRQFPNGRANANGAMWLCASMYPDITKWAIYYPSINRLIITIWRTP
jgi:hypothetical protein